MLWNEGSLKDTLPHEVPKNVATNLASDFTPESERPTFDQILKSIKQGIKLTLDLNLRPQTVDLQNKLIENLIKHKINHLSCFKEKWYDTKVHVDSYNNFKFQVCEYARKSANILARIMPNESSVGLGPELIKIIMCLSKIVGVWEIIIARSRVVMKALWLSKGITSRQGRTLSMDQRIIEFYFCLEIFSWLRLVRRIQMPRVGVKILTLIKRAC